MQDQYADDSEDEEEKIENPAKLPESGGRNFGMPSTMSKTFDVSQAKASVVPKLDFRQLK